MNIFKTRFLFMSNYSINFDLGFFRFAGISILLLLTVTVFAQQSLPRQYEYDATGNSIYPLFILKAILA